MEKKVVFMRLFKSIIPFTLFSRRSYSTVMSSNNTSYENAVHKLNLLQSNKASIDQARWEQKYGKTNRNLEDMENYLGRISIPMSKLDTLSVIHVAGTKGKGSTSAMCESILRQHGFSTGFYSSPHLVSICERIRLNGHVVSKETFAKKFHQIYDRLWASQRFEGDMPKYFAFLTVMAFHMFLEKKVDVAIVEVGIGGLVDYTNVLRKIPVVGITALGLDHTSILGNTLREIAAAKAGIMKRGCESYTVTQPPEAMEVLARVAADVGCPLLIAPEYHKYNIPKGHQNELPVENYILRMNASLAIQLAHAWLRICVKNNSVTVKKRLICGKVMQNTYSEIIDVCEPDKGTALQEIVNEIPLETLQGLRLYKWPGRFQIIKYEYADFYLDGAHTKDSMEICAGWFRDRASSRDKILIFSCTGDRDAKTLLTPLRCLDFVHVYFVVPTAHPATTRKNDNFSALEDRERTSSCHNNANIWRQISNSNSTSCTVHECVHDAMVSIKKLGNNPAVLVTGSLHLVGACLSILDPNLDSS